MNDDPPPDLRALLGRYNRLTSSQRHAIAEVLGIDYAADYDRGVSEKERNRRRLLRVQAGGLWRDFADAIDRAELLK